MSASVFRCGIAGSGKTGRAGALKSMPSLINEDPERDLVDAQPDPVIDGLRDHSVDASRRSEPEQVAAQAGWSPSGTTALAIS
jgi:hypothetical protein